VAALYTARRETPVTVRERSLAAIAAGIGVVCAVALLLLGEIPATKNQVLLFQVSWGFAPSVAALMFYLARCKSPLSWFVENKTIILLGDASYSIYLLQWVFFSVMAAAGVAVNALLVPKIVLAWMMTAILSLGCYRYFERPARSFIRRVMAPDRFSGLFLRKTSAVRALE
jgi:peptidoglycan/LPS O-acetylase OafA/YrhL